MGESNHEIIFHFEDGTTSTISGLTIGFRSKNVVLVTYKVSYGSDLSLYTPYYDTPLGNYLLENGSDGIWTTSIFDIVNYNLDDGNYEIRLVPNGIIYDKEGNELPLPDPIEFTLHVYDDRTINVVFQ